MIRRRRISGPCCALAFALAMLSPGCASRTGPERPSARLAASPLPGEFPLPPSSRSPDEPLSLLEARTLATHRNPELLGLGWALDAELDRVDQAGMLPNPQLAVEVENIGGSRDNPMEATFALGQRFELGGKRGRRVEVAESALEVAEMEHVLGFRNVTGRVTEDFVGVLVAQERVALLDGLLAETREGVANLEADSRRSSAHALDLSRARVELDRARLDRNRAAAVLSAARVRLAATWGGEARRPLAVEGELDSMAPPPPLDSLLAWADEAPGVKRWTKELGRRSAELRRERSLRVPDVTLAAGYRRITAFNENTALVLLGVPIPLFDRNRGNIAAATDEVVRARAQREVARLQLRTNLSVAHERLVTAHQSAIELRDRLVPSSRKAFEDTRAAFHRDMVSFASVLQARSTAYQLRAELLSAFSEYHRAVAEIEELVDLDVGPDF